MEDKKKYSKFQSQKNPAKKAGNKVKTVQEKVNDKGKEIKAKETIITDWFYMTPSEINARMISDVIKMKRDIQVDLWEEFNILQLEFPNNASIDFEPLDPNFKDPSDASFIKNRNIKTIFAVTTEEDGLEEMKSIIKILIEEWEGFLCADTVDFHPKFGKEEL